MTARWRLIPFLFLLYIVAYLDRINVGFAALQMNRALGLSAREYGLGAGIFFISYVLFEIPSNLILARVGARVWIARIMITWGLVSSATMFVRSASGFYVVRFLLGAAEAGFFPGIVFYLTLWFPSEERARTLAGFMTAILAAGVVGGPISGAILGLGGTGGLAGWQWLFLLEGLPAVVLGLAVLRWLPDGPDAATWLAEEEKRRLLDARARDAAAHVTDPTLAVALRDGNVWRLALVYFSIPVALYGFGFWVPQIVKRQTGSSDFIVGVLTSVPYVVGVVSMLLVARHSDRTRERRWHVAIPAAASGAAFAATAIALHARSAAPSVALFSIAIAGLASMLGPFWSLATTYAAGAGAAGAIALINSVGNIGGFVGPYLLGYLHDRTESFGAGLVGVGAILVGAAALTLADGRAARS